MAPTGRGAERRVATTVCGATRSPRASHRWTSSRISRAKSYAQAERWALGRPATANKVAGVIASTGWQVGLAIGVAVVAVAAVIVITIVWLAMKIAKQARLPSRRWRSCGSRPAELGGIARINDSGVRILHAARSLRKVAVGK